MVKVTSKEAKDRFGIVMDTARREPVTVTKHNRPNVVIISAERYEELESLEDKVWAAKAREAEESGYLSNDESEAFIKGILNAEA